MNRNPRSLETTLKFIIRLLVASMVIGFNANLHADADKPLVMEGKKTLYQRGIEHARCADL